jgi:hypothetical protein
MSRPARIFAWILGSLAALLAIAIAAAWFTLRASLPAIDGDAPLAGLGAPDGERQERVLGDGGAPCGGHHRLAVVGGGDVGDVPGRDGLAGGVLALAGLHLVAHEDAHEGAVALRLRADAHRVCHGGLL